MVATFNCSIKGFETSPCSQKTKKKTWLPVSNTKPGFVSVFCEYMEDPTNLQCVKYFWLYSASKKTIFGFCSCSELLQYISFGHNALSYIFKSCNFFSATKVHYIVQHLKNLKNMQPNKSS